MKHRISLYLFCFLGLIYFSTAKGYLAASDSVFSLRTAWSVVCCGSLAISASADEAPWVFRAADGKTYAKYGIGTALLWIPYVLVAVIASAVLKLKALSAMDFLCSFANIFWGAGSAVLMFKLVRFFRGDNRTALVISLLLGLATICWRYSVSDFSEAAQLFFLLAVVYGICLNSGRGLVLASLAAGFLLLVKAANAIYLPVLLVYIFWRSRRPGQRGWLEIFQLSLGPAIALLTILWLNYVRFGNILETGYGREALAFSAAALPSNLGYLLSSPDKGILIYSPVVLFGLLGCGRFFRSARPEALLFFGLILMNLMMYAMWHSPGGGWSWGPRFQVPVVPFLVLPVFFIWKSRGVFRGLIIGLAALSFLVQVLSILQSDHEYHEIRYNLAAAIDPDLPARMPPDIKGSFLLLKHKLTRHNNIYPLAEFGFDTDRVFDTSGEPTYLGPNLWYSHLARKFGRTEIGYVPLLFLPLIFWLGARLFATAVLLDRQKETAGGKI